MSIQDHFYTTTVFSAIPCPTCRTKLDIFLDGTLEVAATEDMNEKLVNVFTKDLFSNWDKWKVYDTVSTSEKYAIRNLSDTMHIRINIYHTKKTVEVCFIHRDAGRDFFNVISLGNEHRNRIYETFDYVKPNLVEKNRMNNIRSIIDGLEKS